MMRWIRVGLTYTGAIAGAGFSSGQEIYQFFSRYKSWGTIGILVAGLLFYVIGWRALEQGRRGVVAASSPKGMYGGTREGVTLAFLVTGLGVVVAGGGATVHQLVGVPTWVGSSITLMLILLVVFFGVQLMMLVNTIVVPYSMLLTLVVAWIYVPRGTSWAKTSLVTPHGWPLSALLYVSYNIFTAILVLFAVGGSLPSRRDTGRAALLGAILLTAMALLEHRVLLGLPTVGDLPLLEAARHIHSTLGLLFGISLWTALFTTGIAEAFAFVDRVGRRWGVGLIGTLPLSFCGFQGMVAMLYPLMGGVASLIWVPLLKSDQDQNLL